jgi:hypothetical protein
MRGDRNSDKNLFGRLVNLNWSGIVLTRFPSF